MKSYETVEPVAFGNYQLVERLAMGGMAEVYLARPSQGAAAERFVALKRILPNIAADDEFIAMFIDEAKIAGQLTHQNIASIFDLGKINNSYFIAMEYVSGHDVRALWDRTRDAGPGGKTALSIGLACFIVKKICDGLDYAHRKRDTKGRPLGIIHRDVSPQNILVSYEGDLKIIDFGIAKAANRMVRTQTGILKGKFAYMAPEQARGEPTDHRADIFAIGVILYELLTGERAFKAESDFALLEKVRKVDVVPPRQLRADIPKELERIIQRALAKDAADRYGWASTLAADLDRFMSEGGMASSKEELGGYLQRLFSAEFQEEQVRLKAYRALFADEERGVSSTQLRSLPSHDSVVSAEQDDDDHARTVAASLNAGLEDDDDADLANDPHAHETWAAATAHSSSGARLGARATSLAQASGDGGGSQGNTSEIENETSAAIAGARRAAHAHSGDETQLETDLEASLPAIKRPQVVARDEIARRTRPPERSAERSDRSAMVPAPAEASASRPRAPQPPPTQPPPLERSAPQRLVAERSGERGQSIERPDRSGRHETKRAGASMVLLAAFFGSLIGAVGMGAVWATQRAPAIDIIIVAQPRQAEVKEGARVLCVQTPCAVAIGAGRHELAFRSPGAEAVTKSVEVTQGVVARVDVTLERSRDDVRLETEPSGAQVYLDERPLASTTPLTLPRLVVGASVRLKLVREGFQVFEVSRVVDDAAVWRFALPTSTTVYTIVPEPRDALVVVTGAPVRDKDGRLQVVLTQNRVAELRLERPGCAQLTAKLRANGHAEAQETIKLECKPMARSGLTIDAPRRASVRIDNVDVARTANLDRYPLPPGLWNVLVRAPRGKSESFTVELRDNEFFRINSKLK